MAFGFADFDFDFEAALDFGFAFDFEAGFVFLLELVELAFFGLDLLELDLLEFDLELAFAPFPLERLCELLPLDLVLPPLLVFVVAIVVLSSR